MRTDSAAPVTIRRLSPPLDHRAELAADIAAGMCSAPKRIPSKYIYDEEGSRLFERITRLPEYYLTRIETAILTEHAPHIVTKADPDELIELGSGASTKTRLLLDAMLAHTRGRRYVPIDISQPALAAAVKTLCDDYPTLAIDGLVGDYEKDLALIPRRGRRLVTFLGSTIGNYPKTPRIEFFSKIRGILEPGDRFLLGVDLMKEPGVVIAAYNDPGGVTAEFTRNVLRVVNRELEADFDVDAFTHLPLWNPVDRCVEAWLEATRPMRVHIGALDLTVPIAGGERIWVEVSCKFTRSGLAGELAEAGLEIEAWYTDPRGWYALALIRPAGPSRRAAV